MNSVSGIRWTLPVVATAVFLVFAGCNGPIGTGEPNERSTVTPAPVPSEESPMGRRPLGMDPNDIHNPAALANAHSERLHETSYTARASQTVSFDNGTQWTRSLTVAIGPDHERFHLAYESSGLQRPNGPSPDRIVYWSDGTRLLQATTDEGSTEFGVYPLYKPTTWENWIDRNRPPGWFSWQVQYSLLAPMKLHVDGSTTRNNTTFLRVVSTDLNAPEVFENVEHVESVRNVGFRALVDKRGFVREYRLTYDTENDGTTVRIVRTVKYTNIGTTAVGRPSWYGAVGTGSSNKTQLSG